MSMGTGSRRSSMLVSGARVCPKKRRVALVLAKFQHYPGLSHSWPIRLTKQRPKIGGLRLKDRRASTSSISRRGPAGAPEDRRALGRRFRRIAGAPMQISPVVYYAGTASEVGRAGNYLIPRRRAAGERDTDIYDGRPIASTAS